MLWKSWSILRESPSLSEKVVLFCSVKGSLPLSIVELAKYYGLLVAGMLLVRFEALSFFGLLHCLRGHSCQQDYAEH